jgi:hypothetical protein
MPLEVKRVRSTLNRNGCASGGHKRDAKPDKHLPHSSRDNPEFSADVMINN